jgi:hypothetical protein
VSDCDGEEPTMCSGRPEEHLGGGTTEQTALGPRRGPWWEKRETRGDRRSMARLVVDHEGDRGGRQGSGAAGAAPGLFFRRCRDGGVAGAVQ